MFRLNDLILLIVIYSSLLAGILFPVVCSFFRPLPQYSMMFLLFLSFLSIRVTDIWVIARKSANDKDFLDHLAEWVLRVMETLEPQEAEPVTVEVSDGPTFQDVRPGRR